jgi:hypothetical protein
MPVERPYKRTVRQFVDGQYAEGGRWQYVMHQQFGGPPPGHYLRAFYLLQQDMQRLFEYIEPAEQNLDCYSYRVHELLLRACIEVEANSKAILTANQYQAARRLDMRDYRLIEQSHRLSAYQIQVPTWHGTGAIRRPFLQWANDEALPWYRAYHASKHDRHESFRQATFGCMLDAVAAVAVLLSAQFWTHDFEPVSAIVGRFGPDDGFDAALGGYLRVRFPDDWPQEGRYEFDWAQLRNEDDPFQPFPYVVP